MKYIIGVDIGTQGTKAALYDENMTLIGTAFYESNLIMPDSGGIWQEADEIYESVFTSIRRLVEEAGVPAGAVEGIGIDSQMAGIMGVDEQGEAVTYYDSWLDSRCGKYVSLMEAQAGEKVTQITGSPVSIAHGPKILWWKNEHPEIYKKICKFVQPHAYVAGKLAGIKGGDAYVDYTCLQYSGFGDNKAKKWSEELLDIFDVEEAKMPRIVPPFEIVGKLKKEAAGLCGLREGTPIAAGAGDTSASIFGAGLFETGTILDCAGTASVVCSAVNEYKPDLANRTMMMMRSPVDGVWYPLAYINGGGLCVRWLRNLFPGAAYEELEAEAEKVEPGSDGLIFIPHFEGRVLPNNPNVRGSFTGLNWRHQRGHMYRAVMEGIAYEYHYYQKILKQLYPLHSFQKVWATGGGAKSKLFLKIKAEVLNAEISSFEMEDTALTGVAVIAGTGIGMIDDYKKIIEKNRKLRWQYAAGEEERTGSVNSMNSLDSENSPKSKNSKNYEKMAEKYLKVIDCLAPIYKEG
ncbi:MAG: FGGY family carbohydrate kinase [Clostridium sp.]|nr:FGGY family carbohydrate kinase [Clostridium sp.]